MTSSIITDEDLKREGLIFDIQRFSLHDGGGIRTLIFMKGCPLRCEWCSNPESQESKQQIMFYEELCIGCRSCLDACPFDTQDEIWPIDQGTCIGCGKCAMRCYAEAKRLIGSWYTVQDTIDVILRDSVFYEESGGGVTVGGGEPSNQPKFVSALLKVCKYKGIHTAVETCGYAQWQVLKSILEYTDLVLFDIKHMDSSLHKEKTGAGNNLILENAVRASRFCKRMIVRLPLIPGFNDTESNLHALGTFIRGELKNAECLHLLPYHSTGASKSGRLGKAYAFHGGNTQTAESIGRAKAVLESYGVKVKIGG